MNETLTSSKLASSPRIVLVGAAHMDRVARSGEPYRAGASNPGVVQSRVGGAAFNAARALACYGARLDLVSARGGDGDGLTVAEAIEALGIGDRSSTWLDRRTAQYLAVLDAGGELVAGVADMAIYDLLLPRVLMRRHQRQALIESDAVFLDANLPSATLTQLAATDLRIAAIGVSPEKVVRLRPTLDRLEALFLSRAEALAMLALDATATADDVLAALRRAGVRRAVVTDGPRSALVVDGPNAWMQTPPNVEAVADVTGAGDTLAAVAFAEWLAGRPFLQAARAGMSAAALHITSGLPASCAASCRQRGAALPLAIPLPIETSRP
ncbi:PfkB family carbohydrate kinase [Aureimonas pseudogalii]|uniref:Sugar/nucleoside kinase (Ribokinase family) n=1 Tax=Aureimonas pseudogalii TaxID=1744844 RepID=A0A7W6H5Y0_9HYPH|nr:PfkB family carbohydrate kinase [Aureimonas pseudogalii]MBB3999166.1 sugar/nucleoside kinase (ribokinase family) [Aureimonas pseudogalii]